MDDSFKNLNGPSADSIQADYIEKEKRAAEELLEIQLKNARTLSQARIALLKKLSDEAREQGQDIEEYLAQYGLSKRLDALSTELLERRKGYETHLAELATAYDSANQKLVEADRKLAEIRKQNINQVATYQADQIKRLAALERQAIEESRHLKEKAAEDAAALAALESAELAISPELSTDEVDINAHLITPALEPLETSLDVSDVSIPSIADTLQAAEAKALRTRIEGLETIKLIEQNIIDLRFGAEEAITNSRIALLANQANVVNSSGTGDQSSANIPVSSNQAVSEVVSEAAAKANEELKSLSSKLVSQQESLKTAQELFVVQQRLLSLARAEEEEAKQRGIEEAGLVELSAKRERLEKEFAEAAQGVSTAVQKELEIRQKITTAKLAANNISDPTIANVKSAVAERLQALKDFYVEQRDLINTSTDLSEAEKETKLAELHAKEIADYATLAKAKMAFEQDVADFKLELDQKGAQERLAQILALHTQEQTSEADLQQQRLANLREASRARPRSTNIKGGGEEAYDFEADPTKPTKEELAGQKKEDLSAALGSFEETILKQAEALEKANIEKDQKSTENMFKGLWNMGHSLEEIKDVYTNYGHLESSDKEGIEAVALQQILAGLDQEQEVDLAAQAQELQDILMAAALAGKELSDEEIKAQKQAIAEAHAATQEDIASRRDGASTEAKMRAAEVQKTMKDGEKSRKAQEKLDKKRQREESKFGKSALGKALSTAGTLVNPFGDLKAHMEAGDLKPEEATKQAQAKLDAAFDAVGGWITQLASQGKTASMKQASIDTNLQGSQSNGTVLGSYWRKLDAKINMGVGVSPFVLQENVAKSAETLAGQGISFNIQQRALMDTLKDKIATTFNAADGTMLKLIRIQQADTTAARLGMESALTSFLNSMYETSEFMHTTAASIRDNLYEATALMGAKEATAYEFQVQKWLGSLYSVGFSATTQVSEALGKLTAGDISGITEGGLGNLLVMAANEASIPIAEILEKGLTADQTDRLMESMVNYLAGIYDETKDSNVLAQQYGNVFGVTAADLKAAANLMKDNTMKNISAKDMEYKDMLGQLHNMANTMILRTSTAEMFENIKANFSYTMATTLANNPVLSGINMMANMLNDLVGGIEIPFVNVYGFGFDLNATVADLMNVAALSGAVLGGMGKMVASLASGGGFSGSGMLKAFGVEDGDKLSAVSRGNGGVNLTTQGGSAQSESGSVAGNESGDDIQNKTLQDASEGPEKQIAEAKEEQEDKEETRHVAVLNQILSIYDLLEEVTNGVRKWHVQLEVGNNPASWSTGTWA